VWDAETGRLYGLNASGRAPASLTADKVPAEEDGTIPLYAPYAWTIPGTVDGWFTLHEKFGALPMKELLAPAIRAARDGEPVPEVIAAAWERSARVFRDKPGFASTFLPDGRAPRVGESFRNPDLAKSLQLIAEHGADAFYRGAIAEAIVAFSEKHGGFIAREDLADHRSEWVEPVSTTYRGVELWELPPNGQGIAALQMLNILESFDLRGMGRDSVDFWHVMVEAKKLAFEDRARFYADPEFADVPVEWLISKEYGRERAALIDMKRAARTVEAGHPPLSEGDTTFLCTADAKGNMVALIQSNYTGFGSGYVVEGWGFGIQDRGGLFNLDPESANYLEPGKRPFHTIIPAFVTRDGKPWMDFGVMGGDMQPQGLRNEPAGGRRRRALLPRRVVGTDGDAHDHRRSAVPGDGRTGADPARPGEARPPHRRDGRPVRGLPGHCAGSGDRRLRRGHRIPQGRLRAGVLDHPATGS
jgi:gamma-glutamyltranspeptidase/glutathione hydrolase